MPNITPTSTDWPNSLDDLRRNPGRLVFLGDLARLGIVRSYDGARKLPPPMKMPSMKKAWEARTILAAIGAEPEPPANAA